MPVVVAFGVGAGFLCDDDPLPVGRDVELPDPGAAHRGAIREGRDDLSRAGAEIAVVDRDVAVRFALRLELSRGAEHEATAVRREAPTDESGRIRRAWILRADHPLAD